MGYLLQGPEGSLYGKYLQCIAKFNDNSLHFGFYTNQSGTELAIDRVLYTNFTTRHGLIDFVLKIIKINNAFSCRHQMTCNLNFIIRKVTRTNYILKWIRREVVKSFIKKVKVVASLSVLSLKPAAT